MEFYRNAKNNDNIRLEPRLQLYCEQLIAKKNNPMYPNISLERRFNISDNDLVKIRNYYKGESIYNSKNTKKYNDMIKQENIKFVGDYYKESDIYNNLKKKQKKDKIALKKLNKYKVEPNDYLINDIGIDNIHNLTDNIFYDNEPTTKTSKEIPFINNNLNEYNIDIETEIRNANLNTNEKLYESTFEYQFPPDFGIDNEIPIQTMVPIASRLSNKKLVYK